MSWWYRVGDLVRYTNKAKAPGHPLQDKVGTVLVKSKPGGIQNYLVDFGDRRVVVSGWNLRRAIARAVKRACEEQA